MSRRLVLIVLTLCSLSPLWLTSAFAQEPPLWPGAKYDPAIPTIKQVLGHDHGEVITPPEGVAQYLAGAAEGRADAHAPDRVRANVGGTAAVAVRDRQCRSHCQARSGQGRPAALCRPAQRRPGRIRSARPRTPRRRLARPRRARQRDLVGRRGAGRGLSPAGRAGRCRRRRGHARGAGADRSHAEPRRPRPVRVPEPAGPRRRRPMRRRTPPSTTSRGPAADRITISST